MPNTKQPNTEPVSSPDSSRSPGIALNVEAPSPERPSVQRPPPRPASPAMHHSTSSILTMSKLYQQQQQSGSLTPSIKTKQPPPKKLHQKVLSSGSLNDYFNTSRSGNSSGANSPNYSESNLLHPTKSAESPGPRLPTFQRIDSFADEIKPNQNSSSIPHSLNASKIYGRRKLKSEEEDLGDADIVKIDEALDEALAHDDKVDEFANKCYNKKKTDMSKKTVEFFNSDSESDVDIHSELETTQPSQGRGNASGSASSSSDNMKDHDNQSETDKPKGLRGLIRRMTVSEGHEDFPERLRNRFDDFEANDNKDGFFSKFINLSGGGLIPGAAKAEEKHRQPDEETEIENGIPLQTFDPEQFANEASDIIKAHSATGKQKSTRDHSDETTLKESINSTQESFLAPNPDLYLRDEDNIFELDGGPAIPSDSSYIAPPERVRGGVLSSLLKLYQNPEEASRSKLTLVNSEANSLVTTPSADEREGYFSDNATAKQSLAGRLKKFAPGKKVQIDNDNLSAQQSRIFNHKKNSSVSDISQFLTPQFNSKKKNTSSTNLPSFSKTARPKLKKGGSAHGLIKKQREQRQARITVHIADILQRQRFILRMSKALMLYGAPTHRLEEYLTMTARVLEIDAQFIYLPGVMIISFGDATTRTSEVQLVRCVQGLNLYKLHRVHRIYKQVIHDLLGVEEASTALDELLAQKPQFSPFLCVLIFAFSSAMVTPFAFGGGWINLPVSFCIGGCVGILQFYVAPRSNLYSNVFEVTASIVVSFIGRALGSINGSKICFSAIVQGSLALILPGYIILCGSLELQSRNLVAGSVRMFYAIIYSLFLSFGITLGAAMYGWIDKNATSETTCSDSINPWWNFLFVPMFTLGLALINQARWFQLPIMLLISSAGYVVNYFASKHFTDSTEFTAAIGAFVIGVLGNLYSRVWKGLAVSAMLPGIFVQVPGGISSQASLLAGVESANQLVSNSTSSSSSSSTSSLSFGLTMVQVAIGISVGLFASTIVVYPFGKKQTSVFTL